MRIDGIVACSGKEYSARFIKALPAWLNEIDTVTVVCKPTDDKILELSAPNLKIVTTTVFTDYGAYFNKGAALNYAYAASDPQDWALAFDADITPASGLKNLILNETHTLGRFNRRPTQMLSRNNDPVGPQIGCLHGAFRRALGTRVTKSGVGVIGNRGNPVGYFQLWHTSDPVTWKWPLFDTIYQHCACYDMNFIELWPVEKRRMYRFTVEHEGRGRINWFGEENQDRMRPLSREGIRQHRLRVQQEIGRTLSIPDFQHDLFISTDLNKPEEIQDLLRLARSKGPFAVRIKTGPAPYNTPSVSLDELRKMVEECPTNSTPQVLGTK